MPYSLMLYQYYDKYRLSTVGTPKGKSIYLSVNPVSSHNSIMCIFISRTDQTHLHALIKIYKYKYCIVVNSNSNSNSNSSHNMDSIIFLTILN